MEAGLGNRAARERELHGLPGRVQKLAQLLGQEGEERRVDVLGERRGGVGGSDRLSAEEVLRQGADDAGGDWERLCGRPRLGGEGEAVFKRRGLARVERDFLPDQALECRDGGEI